MSDTTQAQSHTFVERAVLMIEQQQMEATAPLRSMDASPLHARETLSKAKSPWPVRIAGFATVFAFGIGVGNWLGRNAQPEFHFASALAQDAVNHSRLPALQLRIDADFERVEAQRR